MENELKHYGVLGMHWGVRRYSTVKGTNPKAKKKSSRAEESELKKTKKGIDSAKSITDEAKNINRVIDKNRKPKTTKTDDLSKMSDQELRDRVNRMNMEQQYNRLSSKDVESGRSYVSDTLEVAGSVLGIASSAVTIALAVKQLRK